MALGAEMLVNALMNMAGINPEEVKNQVIIYADLFKQTADRLDRIEQKLDLLLSINGVQDMKSNAEVVFLIEEKEVSNG